MKLPAGARSNAATSVGQDLRKSKFCIDARA